MLPRILSILLVTLPILPNSSPILNQRATSPPPDWILHNITVWTTKGEPGADYIDFQFQDVRKEFPLRTNCRRAILPSDAGSIADGNFHPCHNRTVGFQFNGKHFEITRSYIDPSVGPPGEDVVTAMGGNNATLAASDRPCGVLQTLKDLDVNIMTLVAR